MRRGSRTTPRARRRRVVTQDALVEGVHFRLDWISWRDLGWRAAAVNLSDLAASGADAEGLLVDARRPARRRRSKTSSSSMKGSPRPGCPCSAATRLERKAAHAQRDRDRPLASGCRAEPGRCPGDQLVVTGPLGACGRCVPARVLRAAAASPGRGQASSARTRTRCSTSPTARRRRRPHRGAVRLPGRHRARAGPARCWSASSPTSGSARTTSCSRRSRDPSGFTIIGRCEEGEGVELMLNGEPYELGGWQHFR